jgi:hypothetical protein
MNSTEPHTMSWPRTIGVTAAATAAVWLASLLAWIGILYASLSSICSDWTPEAECNARQHDAAVTSTFMGVLLTAIAVGLLFLLIRAVAQPRVRRERWYLVGAVAIAPMPTAVVVGAILVSTPGASLALGISATVVLTIAWATGWAWGLRWLIGRELGREAAAADAPASA